MCGIVGYIGPKRVVPLILDGLRRLEYRGYDSAGIAVVGDNGKMEIRRAPGKLRNLEESIRITPLDGVYGIGHTRWATHGRPTEENAHPHRDCTGQIVVVHNGIVENYLELKEKLQKEGHKFVTETDTEIVAHLVEKNSQGGVPLEEAVRKSLKELRGIYALVFLSANDPQKIVAARLGPPSVIGLGDGEYFVASDIPALLQHTREKPHHAVVVVETVPRERQPGEVCESQSPCHFGQFRRSHPAAIGRTYHGPDAGPGNVVHRDALFFQHLQNADVGNTAGKPSAQCQAQSRTTRRSSHGTAQFPGKSAHGTNDSTKTAHCLAPFGPRPSPHGRHCLNPTAARHHAAISLRKEVPFAAHSSISLRFKLAARDVASAL